MVKITFLGQAGLLFETDKTKLITDPYFSDTVRLCDSKKYRRQPADPFFQSLKPNVLVITHSHADHYDKPIVEKYLSYGNVTVLSPYSVWRDITDYGGENNYVLFRDGTSYTVGDIELRAVKAEHSDVDAIGVIITCEGENYYVTGDTLYSERVFESLPNIAFRAVFLPINGAGNNMNIKDAERFVSRVKTKYAVPLHFGMLDDMSGEAFSFRNTVIPKIYKEIVLK